MSNSSYKIKPKSEFAGVTEYTVHNISEGTKGAEIEYLFKNTRNAPSQEFIDGVKSKMQQQDYFILKFLIEHPNVPVTIYDLREAYYRDNKKNKPSYEYDGATEKDTRNLTAGWVQSIIGRIRIYLFDSRPTCKELINCGITDVKAKKVIVTSEDGDTYKLDADVIRIGVQSTQDDTETKEGRVEPEASIVCKYWVFGEIVEHLIETINNGVDIDDARIKQFYYQVIFDYIHAYDEAKRSTIESGLNDLLVYLYKLWKRYPNEKEILLEAIALTNSDRETIHEIVKLKEEI